MRVGDHKKAAVLGVVAIIALGFVGKTALGAFSGHGSNQPLKVINQGGPIQGSEPTTAPAPVDSTEKTPNSAPNQSSAMPTNPGLIVRDAFTKPESQKPVKTSQFETAQRSKSCETYSESTPANPFDPGIAGNLPPGDSKPDPKSIPGTDDQSKGPKTEATKDIETKKSKPSVVVKFEGFVDAGSPMGIISIQGSSFSVRVGEVVDGGYKILSISNDKIKIQKGQFTKTISIGKETQF